MNVMAKFSAALLWHFIKYWPHKSTGPKNWHGTNHKSGNKEKKLGQIENLRAFALVVENQSISRAADKLNIAKSAVSRRLKLLEERLGTQLINREPGVWNVTDAGREVYQRATSVLNEIDEIDTDFGDARQDLAGPLTISVPRNFGVAFLTPALLAFKARHPEIQFSIDFDDRLVELTRENYDFTVRVTAKLEDNLAATKIGETSHQLYATPAYLAAYGNPQGLEQLLTHQLLYYGPAKRGRWDFINERGKAETIEFHPTLNSNSGAFLLQATLQGLGIARLPEFISTPAISSGALVPVLPTFSVPKWGIFLIHAEERRLNRRMRLFAKDMQSACVSS